MDQDKIKQLVAKYDRPGPRYTSYPTAPEWSDQYGPNDYTAALAAASKKIDEPLSFYLHIPFCRKRCWFCGCTTTIAAEPSQIDKYLNAVDIETKMIADSLKDRTSISQFHWGGGTPSFLSSEQTKKAYEIFSSRFEILENAEVSIELDPRTTTPERIALLRSLGFNRLSMGVQDFDHDVQEAIGRSQDKDLVITLYKLCRAAGFGGINFDLVYGLPKQTLAGFVETLSKTIELGPDRVALYSYAHLPQRQPNQRSIDESTLPSAQLKSDLFALARERFLDGGYVHIGMDHFVLPGDELAIAAARGKLRRNFMGYTVNAAADWVGIGMSSISYVSDNFAQNRSDIAGYSDVIARGEYATYRGMVLSLDDLIRQQAIMNLMCNFKLDYSEMDRRFNIVTSKYFQTELAELKSFADDGLLILTPQGIEISSEGRLFVRNIAMPFDAYLKKDRDGYPKAQFSRTI
jgi:oxygen-independent coproporphyrinogen III oxidase